MGGEKPPLKNEGFKKAKWFEINEAFRKASFSESKGIILKTLMVMRYSPELVG